ncbi:MAG: HlyC/CorC family transporter [Anaerolineae bacterium]|nr:HlyC/CorC family transporter [Anaerolineae bacterium]
MDEGSISSLTILVILLAANVLLALGYHALINARRSLLENQAADGRAGAALALRLSEEATQLVNTYQLSLIVIRFFSAGIAAIGLAPKFGQWLVGLGMGALLALVISELVVLLFGAIVMLVVGGQVPAAVGGAYANRLALALVRPMWLLVRVLSPVANVLRGISDGIVRLLGIQARVRNVTEEEIMTLVDAGQEEGVIEDEEKEMIYSIFQLGDTAVREVMVPRLDMVTLPLKTPLDEAVRTVIAAGHSRIPVYEDNIDHVRGLLYAKDLLKLWGKGGNGDALANLLRPTYFVPEGKNAMTLLQEMQQRRVHLAVVVDEYGGTAGLVTLEDLIEEIIGEVQDEYDLNEEAAYQQVNDNEYICNARLDLDDLNRLLDIALPTDENDTLGGYIFSKVGEVPEPGTVIETPEVRIVVLSVDRHRIGQVRVTRLDPVESGDEVPAAR